MPKFKDKENVNSYQKLSKSFFFVSASMLNKLFDTLLVMYLLYSKNKKKLMHWEKSVHVQMIKMGIFFEWPYTDAKKWPRKMKFFYKDI